jgi:uncharacterized protein
MPDSLIHRTDPTLIFETVHGSTAYNLAREGSDVDVKGIIIGPRSWYFGIESAPEQIDVTADHVRYELRKFMRLAAEGNPTLLELLFVDERHHQTVTPFGTLLLAHRHAFLSKHIAERFGGYALSQLKRIRTHRSHLIDPPQSAPTRAAFDLPEHTVIAADQLAAAELLLASGDSEAADVSPNFYELLLRERRYKAALKGWQLYQQWLKGRNPKRSELEARFGYDTKHAMHLVRLQRMGLEALSTGELNVTRADRDELLAIRDGIWSFDELEAQAELADARLQTAKLTTVLPDEPNAVLLNNLCIQIIEGQLNADG